MKLRGVWMLGGVLVAAMAPAAGLLAQASTVTVGDNSYNPAGLTVSAGTQVTWTDNGNNPHSVTADGNTFDSHPTCSGAATNNCMKKGDSFNVTFTSPGTFPYHCRIHGGPGGIGMSGTVTVQQAGGSPTPTAAPTAAPTQAPTVRPTATPRITATPSPPRTASPTPSSPPPSITPTPVVALATPTIEPTPDLTPQPDGDTPSNTGRNVATAAAAVLLLSGAGLAFWRLRGRI